MARLGPWLRIAQFLTFLPLGSVITRVPSSIVSNKEVVVKTLRGFPQFGCVVGGPKGPEGSLGSPTREYHAFHAPCCQQILSAL
jgi:hypothetical protein